MFKRIGLLSAVMLVVACSSDRAAGPIVGPPDPAPSPDPRIVLFAVPQRQAEGTVSISFKDHPSAARVHTMDDGISVEPWNADSIVYTVGDSTGYPTGLITLSLTVKVSDFNTQDSAGVPGQTVMWAGMRDAYSHPTPEMLENSETTTDANGLTINNFTFTEGDLNDSGGYFYVEAFLADSTGAFVKQAKFYIINWQQPTWIAYWNGFFPVGGFDQLSVPATVDPITQTVSINIAEHLTFPVFEGADIHIGDMAIGLIAADGCSVEGTTLTCPTTALPARIDVYPDLGTMPAGKVLNDWQNNVDAHTFFELTAAP